MDTEYKVKRAKKIMFYGFIIEIAAILWFVYGFIFSPAPATIAQLGAIIALLITGSGISFWGTLRLRKANLEAEQYISRY